MHQRNRKIEGVILRKTNYGEADLILTILTKEDGRLDCIAKGARRFKSRFSGRLGLFNQVQLELFEGRSLHAVNEAELIDVTTNWDGDLEGSSVAFLLAEITQKLLQPDQIIPGVYPLLMATIALLAENREPENILYAYFIQLFGLLGFMPSWQHCVLCDEKLNLDRSVHLDADSLSLHCRSCDSSGTPLQTSLIKAIHFIQSYPLPESLKLDLEDERDALWSWLTRVLADLLNQPIRSLAFVEQLRSV